LIKEYSSRPIKWMLAMTYKFVNRPPNSFMALAYAG
jgi:hypothetical protein